MEIDESTDKSGEETSVAEVETVLEVEVVPEVESVIDDAPDKKDNPDEEKTTKIDIEYPTEVEVEADDFEVDAATLIARGKRKGSRFSADGTPLVLKSYLESASSDLHFFFHLKVVPGNFGSLENDVEKRSIGKKFRYELYEGEFRLSDTYSTTAPDYQSQKVGKVSYKFADMYKIQVDLDSNLVAGIMPGKKIPVVTDHNPHQLGLVDQHKCIFTPFSDSFNFLMELPNTANMFFTTQVLQKSEVFITYDKALRKYWLIVMNRIYIPSKDPLLSPNEVGWRRAVDNQAYVERIQDFMATTGNNLEVIVRVSPSTEFLGLSVSSGGQTVHPAQQRIDNYFRDEIVTSAGKMRCYYYEDEGMVYGFYEEGDWKFGIKDRYRPGYNELGLARRWKDSDSLSLKAENDLIPFYKRYMY